jgi:pSer/pThr/pTyr-binding forkhead associated (FHA) protein
VVTQRNEKVAPGTGETVVDRNGPRRSEGEEEGEAGQASPDKVYSDIFQQVMSGGGDAHPKQFALVCFPLDPVPVQPERVLTIGRSKQNDLILPVGMVSRNHSRIQWNGSAFVIEDLGSSNGTFVNETEVKSRDLSDGDEIKIGPYNLTFRSYTGDINMLKGGGTEALDVTQNITRREILEKSSTFSGTIGEMRLDEVFQLVEFNKKTGTLHVKSGDKKGTFYFREGQILDGDFHNSRGVTAVARSLSLQTGDFSFLAGDPTVEQTIFQGTGKIVLDAMRKLDELDR